MRIKRVISIVLSFILVIALVPTAAIAEEAAYQLNERKLLGLMDKAWEILDATEAESIALGAEPHAVTMAVYRAALQCDLIDEGSFADLDGNGFSFRVNGMACGYDYRIRNTAHKSALDQQTIEAIADYSNTKNGPSTMNVLLVAPYYAIDGSFTDQYELEAASIAEATGGEVIQLIDAAATGPAIAEAAVNAGVVIYDSHGSAYEGTSYLSLTNGDGLTSTDYTNGWAYNGGSWHGIDGRYIANHIPQDLPNNIFWMAICEGMMQSGNGVTGYALLEAGAGCVYGYSKSVTFIGEYMYERAFWNVMKAGGTVADAFNEMVREHGVPDPRGDAYPIVMSPLDPFPSNPDELQTVYCDWALFDGSADPIALTSFSLSGATAEVHESFTTTINFLREPERANVYDLIWESSDESIITVNGNKRKVTIYGVSEGTATVTCRVMTEGELFGIATAEVTVLHYPNLNEGANAEGGLLSFTTTAEFPWHGYVDSDGEITAKSGNVGKHSTVSAMELNMSLAAEDVITFDWRADSERGYDYLKFYVNGSQVGLGMSGIDNSWSSVTYTVPSSGDYTFSWRFIKDDGVSAGDDCGYVKNIHVATSMLPMLGDIDGDMEITSYDALMVLRYVLGTGELNAMQLICADYNQNGSVTLEDALAIMRVNLSL